MLQVHASSAGAASRSAASETDAERDIAEELTKLWRHAGPPVEACAWGSADDEDTDADTEADEDMGDDWSGDEDENEHGLPAAEAAGQLSGVVMPDDSSDDDDDDERAGMEVRPQPWTPQLAAAPLQQQQTEQDQRRALRAAAAAAAARQAGGAVSADGSVEVSVQLQQQQSAPDPLTQQRRQQGAMKPAWSSPQGAGKAATASPPQGPASPGSSSKAAASLQRGARQCFNLTAVASTAHIISPSAAGQVPSRTGTPPDGAAADVASPHTQQAARRVSLEGFTIEEWRQPPCSSPGVLYCAIDVAL